MGPIEVFKFEVRPYVYGGPNDTMAKSLKVMAQVNGQQFTELRVLPMQPANKTELEYYTDMAVRALHGAMDAYEKEHTDKNQPDQKAKV
jgi:hypothetical protein